MTAPSVFIAATTTIHWPKVVPESQYVAALAEVASLTVDLAACEQELTEAQEEADVLERSLERCCAQRDKAIEMATDAVATTTHALELAEL